MKDSAKTGIAIVAGVSVIGGVVAAVAYSSKFSTPPSSPPPSTTYSNTITASKVSITAGESIDFTAKVEEVSPAIKPLAGIPVTFLENVTQSEGTATTGSDGVATMAITFAQPGIYEIRAVAKSSLFCGSPSSSAPCSLDSGTLAITVLPEAPVNEYSFSDVNIPPNSAGGQQVTSTGRSPVLYIDTITVPAAGKYGVMLVNATYSTRSFYGFGGLTFAQPGTYALKKQYTFSFKPSAGSFLQLWNAATSPEAYTISGYLEY